MRARLFTVSAVVSALAVAGAGGARAGDLEIAPIKVELTQAQPTTLLTVRNGGATPTRITVKLFAWDQDPRGEMVLTPTTDAVAFPPLLEIAPGASRNIRVGASRPPGATERSYRVFVEEMPAPADQATQVQVLSRIGVPVFVVPASPAARLQVGALAVADGRASFTVRNAGNAHVRTTAVKLALHASDGKILVEHPLDAWYLLAGGERRYELPMSTQGCAGARTATVTVEHDGGPVQRAFPLPADACPP
jgi:fimbrial chaperone protein